MLLRAAAEMGAAELLWTLEVREEIGALPVAVVEEAVAEAVAEAAEEVTPVGPDALGPADLVLC